MTQRRFRIVDQDGDARPAPPVSSRPASVKITLAEILPILADAYNNEKSWVKDLEDEEITVSNDLFEVISAYSYYTRPTG